MMIRQPEPYLVRKDLTLEFAKTQLTFIIFNPINILLKKVLLEIVLPCLKYVFMVKLYFSIGAENHFAQVENYFAQVENHFARVETYFARVENHFA